ncbi:MAG: hypothetical protein RIT81_19795 [Deltaproteobacteria bacterium]
MVSRANDFGVLNPWLWGPTQPWADLLPSEQALPQLFAPEDQATIGAAPDDDIQAWLQQQQDPMQLFEALATAALVSLLIDYLSNDMHQQDAAPRQAGQLPGASFANGPQPTSWGSGGAPAPTTAPSAAPITASNLPPGQGLENLDVHVIGDSLMVGARGQTEAALRGAGAADVTIDAAGGRAINGSGAGHHVSPAEIRQMAEQSGADVLVLELGSNHNDYARFVPETMDQLATLNPPPTVVWVNTQTQRPNGASYGQSYYDGNAAINDVIAQQAARRPNMFVADWSQIAGANTDGGDGLHLSGAGNDAMAQLIRDTIAAARS